MATNADAERTQLMGGNDSSVGRAMNLKSGRTKQIDDAVDKAVNPSAPPSSVSTSQTASGVDFFKGRKSTPAQADAKKKALLSKMRARGDFDKKAGVNDQDEDDN